MTAWALALANDKVVDIKHLRELFHGQSVNSDFFGREIGAVDGAVKQRSALPYQQILAIPFVVDAPHPLPTPFIQIGKVEKIRVPQGSL